MAIIRENDADDIADCVLKTYDSLPQRFKPRTLADGRREWVPLAGIVLRRGMVPTNDLAANT